MPRKPISVTRGMANAVARVKLQCTECGTKVPVYRGRYPKMCSHCGGKLAAFQETEGLEYAVAAVAEGGDAKALVDAIVEQNGEIPLGDRGEILPTQSAVGPSTTLNFNPDEDAGVGLPEGEVWLRGLGIGARVALINDEDEMRGQIGTIDEIAENGTFTVALDNGSRRQLQEYELSLVDAQVGSSISPGTSVGALDASPLMDRSGVDPTQEGLVTELRCLGAVDTATMRQEWYKTGSGDVATRMNELKRAGFRVLSQKMGPQVTKEGTLDLTLVSILNPSDEIPKVECGFLR